MFLLTKGVFLWVVLAVPAVRTRYAGKGRDLLSNDSTCLSHPSSTEACIEMEWLSLRKFVLFKENVFNLTHTGWNFMRNHSNVTDGSLITENVNEGTYSQSRYVNLQGKHLRVGLNPMYSKEGHNVKSDFSDFCMELLKEISKRFNFTYSIFRPKDGQWGIRVNNTWNGLMGMVVRHEVDLASAPLTATAIRMKEAEMACTVAELKIEMWILNPTLRQEKWLIIFHLMDWMTSALLVASFVVVVVVFTVITGFFLQDQATNAGLLNNMMMNCFLFARSFLQQGSPRLPESVAGRSLLSLWWWFSIIFSVTYSGTMVATLSDTTTVYPFNTVQELLLQTEYKWGYVGGTAVESFLRDSKRPLIQQLRKSVEEFALSDPSVISTNTTLHLEKVKAEKYVAIMNLGVARAAEYGFVSLREGLENNIQCLAVPKGSPIAKPLKNLVADMEACGIIKYLDKKYNSGASNGNKVDLEVTLSATSLRVTKSVFYTLSIGIAVSGTVLFVEIVFQWQRNRLRRKKTNRVIRDKSMNKVTCSV